MAPTFSFRSRYALLTYAQCGDLDPWAVLDMVSAVPAECIIARESHNDGEPHLHAFVDFGTRFYTGDPRRFDVDGRHPNVLPVGRTPGASYDYCIKDGDVVAGGLERPGSVAGAELPRAGSVWDTILSQPTVGEFWDSLRELAPRNLLINFNSCRAYAEWHYRKEEEVYASPRGLSFDLSGLEGLQGWVQDSLVGASLAWMICARIWRKLNMQCLMICRGGLSTSPLTRDG
uniref:Replication-associated protein n=1 Tax=Grus japonensis Genomoviridae sp. TaxID=2814961 RepID=A0A8A4XC09_9VIRU